MQSRMNNRFVSQPFHTHLRSLKGRITYVQAKTPSESKSGRNHDETFLLSVIPHLANFVTANIPNLKAMAIAAAANKDKDKDFKIKIYNEDTCTEYHDLLCELLDRYSVSLQALKLLQQSAVAKGVAETQTEATTQTKKPCLADILLHLRLVLLLARSLREMVQGSAMEEHLQGIGPLLEVNVGKSWPMSDTSEEDMEFHILKPYSMRHGKLLLPWEAYRNWLKLMVHNLDCIYVLDEYLRSFNSPNIDVEVNILYPSCPDQMMLPWKELLQDERYFPNADEPSNDELITFLTSPTQLDVAALKQIIEKVHVLKQQRKSEINVGTAYMVVDTKDVDSLVQDMGALQCLLPGWYSYSATVIDRMQALKDDRRTPQDGLHLIQVIMDMLEALRGSNLLYEKLNSGTAFKYFLGTRHCEACLCSLKCKNLCKTPHGRVMWLQGKLHVSP